MSVTCILPLVVAGETIYSVRLFMHCKCMARIVDAYIVNMSYDELARRLQRRIQQRCIEHTVE
jgi:hypothetical protein